MLARVHQRQLQIRIMLRVRVDRDRRRLVVFRLGRHDVGHERLRVAIVEREPCALDLHHHRVPGLEDVVHVVQAEPVFAD